MGPTWFIVEGYHGVWYLIVCQVDQGLCHGSPEAAALVLEVEAQFGAVRPPPFHYGNRHWRELLHLFCLVATAVSEWPGFSVLLRLSRIEVCLRIVRSNFEKKS